ncbi:hypothetical protein HZC32_02055 [Candidatus Woesearchaeota archaeon]|nr:hypothetical protein [Candidatus Woesearchaeota archaeon]
MQQETHYIGPISVVPVEGLTRKELFKGIKSNYSLNGNSAIKKGQREIIQRLRKWIPAFVDETVQPGEEQYPNIFKATFYDIPLLHGKVSAEVRISDDLGKLFLEGDFIVGPHWVEHSEEIADRFSRKSGVFITADYQWKSNHGKGLKLKYPDPLQQQWVVLSNDQYLTVFEKVINALCHGIDLTEEIVCGEGRFQYPFSHHGNQEITALVRDASLKAVRAADQPVNEFIEWMQRHAVQVNHIGELVLLANNSYFVAEEHRQRTSGINISTQLPNTIKSVGDQYLKLVQEAFAELHPPKNNRMDYLVH